MHPPPTVFLSYARVDRDVARLVASELQRAGIKVWWDENLVSGEKFSDVIARQLESASYVVVLWSRAGTQSDWVRAEADRARQLGKLVQFTTEACELPLPFSQLQITDLSRHFPARPLPDSFSRGGPALLSLREIIRLNILARIGAPDEENLGDGKDRIRERLRFLARKSVAAALALPIAGISAYAFLLGGMWLLGNLPLFTMDSVWGLFGFATLLTLTLLVFLKTYGLLYTWIQSSGSAA